MKDDKLSVRNARARIAHPLLGEARCRGLCREIGDGGRSCQNFPRLDSGQKENKRKKGKEIILGNDSLVIQFKFGTEARKELEGLQREFGLDDKSGVIKRALGLLQQVVEKRREGWTFIYERGEERVTVDLNDFYGPSDKFA